MKKYKSIFDMMENHKNCPFCNSKLELELYSPFNKINDIIYYDNDIYFILKNNNMNYIISYNNKFYPNDDKSIHEFNLSSTQIILKCSSLRCVNKYMIQSKPLKTNGEDVFDINIYSEIFIIDNYTIYNNWVSKIMELYNNYQLELESIHIDFITLDYKNINNTINRIKMSLVFS